MLLIKMSSPDIGSSLGETTWLENFINSAVVLSLLKPQSPLKMTVELQSLSMWWNSPKA